MFRNRNRIRITRPAPGSAFGVRSGRVATCGIAAAFCAVIGSGVPASAAVRVCKPLVVGEIKRAAGEQAAKRAALADWVAKSKVSGIAHPAWRIAFNKRLKCARVGSQFECVALGQPCTIKHKAPRRGPDPRGPKVET